MKRWIPLILLALSATCGAADVTLTWTNATKNTDGTDIGAVPATALVSTTLKWGACNPDDTPAAPLLEQTFPTTIPGNAETGTVTIFTPGRWCFIGVHTNAGDPANNIDPETSDDSNPVFKQIIMVPEPPDNLVTVEMVAYQVIAQTNKFVLLPVGTVPGGTACTETEMVKNHYVVPREVVAWYGDVEPLAVVAKCA